MIDIDEWTITQAVLKAQAGTQDARLRRVLDALVRHLHDFAREVELTEAEWAQGIDFLTRVGHITDDRRQEFILLSDVLGLSTLVTAQNNRRPGGCTEATVFGPFYVPEAPVVRNGDDIANGAHGQPCFVSGTVRGIGGEPVAGATIDVWQSDEDGTYDVQRPGLDHAEGRARLASGADGRYHFRSILAVPYPIPHDGPVGVAGAHGAAPVAPRAPAFHDPGAGLRDADHPCIPRGWRVPGIGRGVRRTLVPGGRLEAPRSRHVPRRHPHGHALPHAGLRLRAEPLLHRAAGTAMTAAPCPSPTRPVRRASSSAPAASTACPRNWTAWACGAPW